MAAVSEKAKQHRRAQARAYQRTHYARHAEKCNAASRMWHHAQPPEYNIWVKMKQRCLNPRNKDYADYGGRGIRVCARWLTSFENFFADMGPRPFAKSTIDRYPDNDGDYAPFNCRWATRKEQNQNTRQTSFITAWGLTLSRAEWADRTGIPAETIRGRLRLGWSPERAVVWTLEK